MISPGIPLDFPTPYHTNVSYRHTMRRFTNDKEWDFPAFYSCGGVFILVEKITVLWMIGATFEHYR